MISPFSNPTSGYMGRKPSPSKQAAFESKLQ